MEIYKEIPPASITSVSKKTKCTSAARDRQQVLNHVKILKNTKSKGSIDFDNPSIFQDRPKT